MSNNFKKHLKKGDSFCVFPFIHQHINVQNQQKLCCYTHDTLNNVGFNSDEMNKIREAMLSGKKISSCSVCYKLEENNQVSPRQRELSDWSNRYNKELLKNVINYKKGIDPFFYDLRNSNICNLACKTCGPYDSSLWAAEIKSDHKILSNQNVEVAANSKRLYFAGGEPFLIPKFLDQLKRVNKDCEIVINTNCTVYNEEWIDELKKFNNVCITTSIDAFGDLNEYVRYPSKWNKIVDNLHKFNNHGFYLFVNTVISAYTLLDYEKLVEFLEKNFPRSKSHISILNTPESMVYNSLMNFVDLDQYIERLLNYKYVQDNQIVYNRLKNLPRNVTEFEPLAKETLNQDRRRKRKFSNEDFEFYKIYKEIEKYE